MRYLHLIMLVVSMAMLNGCGGGDESASQAAGDTSKPLEGKTLSKSSQLEGTWMAVTEGLYAGFEFMNNGQVLITGLGGTVTMKYDVMEGGRLSLVAPDGQTMVFKSTYSGDLMELAGSSLEFDGYSQRFKRVPQGQTLAEALKAFEQQLETERQQRQDAIVRFLNQQNLVIAPSQGQAAKAITLSLQADGKTIGGRAVVDGDEPATFNVQGGITIEQDTTAKVTLALNEIITSVGQTPRAGRGEFKVEGPNDKLAISGGMTGGAATMDSCVIKVDAAMTKAVNDRIEQIAREHEAAIATIRDPLGVKSVLIGTQTIPNRTEPVNIRVELRRLGDQNAYQGTIVGDDRPSITLAVQGAVELINRKPYLMLRPNTGHIWRMTLEGDLFKGKWQTPGQTPSITNMGNVDVRIEQAWTTAEFEAERQARDQFINKDLQSPQQFVGHMMLRNAPTPVSLTVQTTSDGKVTGTAQYPLLGGGVDLTGQINPGADGPVIQMQAATATGEATFVRTYGRQIWNIGIAQLQPEVKLRGQLSGGMLVGPVELRPLDETRIKNEREQIIQAVNGETFTVPGPVRANEPLPTLVQITIDAASGDATGRVYGGPSNPLRVPSLLAGQLTTENGLIMLRLEQNYQVGGNPSKYELALVGYVDDDAVRLAGPVVINGNAGTTIDLQPTALAVIVPDAQRLTLAAIELGAAMAPPGNAKEGDTIVLLVTGTTRGTVYGAGAYSNSSTPGAAAVHAGLLRDQEMGLIRITYAPPLKVYEGLESNGVTSRAYDFGNRALTGLSFTMERIPVE